MNRKIELIAASFGWGAKRHFTEHGPEILKSLGLFPQLPWRDLSAPLSEASDKHLSYLQRLEQVRFFDQRLAQTVSLVLQERHFPLVLGGDHSIAIGTWSGVISELQANMQFGLIWIDAHMDSHTPTTTPSHAIHGMPLAALLGHGESVLVNLYNRGVKLSPQHVVLIGVRSFEEGEAKLLHDLNVTVYYMSDVQKEGFKSIFAKALKKVSTNTKGFGISIDIDAFDPTIAPGTGSPEPNGLSLPEVCESLRSLHDSPLLKALEIVEYDPQRDIDHKTAYLVKALVESVQGNEYEQNATMD